MPKVRVFRCPECGSLDVYSDEARAAIDISCFVCRACKFEDYADSWERDWDWIAEIEVEAVDKLPDKVEPLPPDKRFHAS